MSFPGQAFCASDDETTILRRFVANAYEIRVGKLPCCWSRETRLQVVSSTPVSRCNDSVTISGDLAISMCRPLAWNERICAQALVASWTFAFWRKPALDCAVSAEHGFYGGLFGGTENVGTKKAPLQGLFRMTGGDGEIRTHDTGLSPYASLAGKCLRPLGHISIPFQQISLDQKTAIIQFRSPFGQWNGVTFFKKLMLFPNRRPCAGRALPVPCIFRQSGPKS